MFRTLERVLKKVLNFFQYKLQLNQRLKFSILP